MKALINFLPLPLLLLCLWLLLNDSIAIGQISLGLVLAIVLSLLAPILRPVRAHIARPLKAISLSINVAIDIAKSNLAVGIRIMHGQRSLAQPGFLDIPLRIRDPHGLAALACIVTFTPGTVWSGHDPDANILTLHVLDLSDGPGLTQIIQKRYQEPLIEIFE